MHEAQIMKSAYRISSKDQLSLVCVGKGKKAQGKCAEPRKKGHDKNNAVLALTNNSSSKEKSTTAKKMHLAQQSFFLP